MAPFSNTCARRCEQSVASLQVVGCAETDRQSRQRQITRSNRAIYRDQRHPRPYKPGTTTPTRMPADHAQAEPPPTVFPALVLPLGRPLHATAVRLHAQAVAQRLEDELGEEQFSFIDTCPAQRENLPRPDLPIVVGLDGGYVHSSTQRSRRDGWFEVIAGKAIPATGKASCFADVQTYHTKPKRRLFQALQAQGMTANQQVTFLTGGGEDIRDLPLYLNAQAEHLLDWFHITMRITVLTNMARSLRPPPPAADPDLELSPEAAARLITGVREDLGRLKWFLWHGNVFRALTTVDGLIGDLEIASPARWRSP